MFITSAFLFVDRFLDLLTQKRRQTADSLSTVTTSNAVQAPVSITAPKPASTNQVQTPAPTADITKSSIVQPKPATQPVNGKAY